MRYEADRPLLTTLQLVDGWKSIIEPSDPVVASRTIHGRPEKTLKSSRVMTKRLVVSQWVSISG